VVSDRDLFKALSPNIGTNIETYKDTATLNKRVHQIMSRKPKILREDATVDAAIDLFNEHAISCIPILSATTAWSASSAGATSCAACAATPTRCHSQFGVSADIQTFRERNVRMSALT
jgi:CBS-domain-containing membrane protein